MKRKSAFTLIELLVVIAIIIALLAILMPSMGRAMEASQRTVCVSNLHQWGLVCINFSGDNFGKFPTATVWSGATQMLLIVEKGDASYTAGTDYRVLRDRYGLSEQVTRCPSSQRESELAPHLATIGYSWNRSRTSMKQNYNATTDEGTQYYLFDYFFIANANNYVGGNKNAPATRTNDAQLATRVFAADAVEWNGYANKWYRQPCHPAGDGFVGWQNRAMGDGAVSHLAAAHYNRQTMNATPTSGASAIHGLVNWFWEGVD